ncbi:hypothetical protein BKA83DRAFT_4345748, partial [Pisolithus microcarpus]
IEAIQDVLDELETVYDNLSKNAKDYIHLDEIILTVGKSCTVEAFLKAATSHQKYTVIVADTPPSLVSWPPIWISMLTYRLRGIVDEASPSPSHPQEYQLCSSLIHQYMV